MRAGMSKWCALAVFALAVAGGGVTFLAWPTWLSPDRPGPQAGGPGAPSQVACLGYVDMEHGVAALDCLHPGRVETVLVKENDRVSAGGGLVRLESQLAQRRLEEARAGLEVARVALEQVRCRPESHRLQLSQQTGSLKAAQQRLSAARQLYDLKRKHFEQQLEARERVAAAEAQVAELEALTQVEANRFLELNLQNPALEVQRAEANVCLRTVQVRLAETELEELTLKAPLAGTVLRILVGPGDIVGRGGKPVLYFCPEGPRLVRVEVEQEFAGRIQPGQPALVLDDIAPGDSWRGSVRRVADWMGPQRMVLDDPGLEREARTFECLIEIEEGPRRLRIGQRVRVWIGVGQGTNTE